MTHSTPAKNPQSALLSPGPLLLTGLIVLAALSRVLPHPPNFSPVEAMALFGGAYFARRGLAVLIPLVAMLISDVALGLINGGEYWSYLTSGGPLSIYALIALCSVLGFGLRGRVSGGRVLGYSLLGSVLFFVISNGLIWLSATAGSPYCGQGLAACYAFALPFFQWTVAGTLFYSAILFGGFELLRRRHPALRPQTV
ncbi:MAG: DUF6580 family putative transport protein [Lysobacteraceae bacterium]|nr:hypothetical protein [Xanthomonadaceae bacterium]